MTKFAIICPESKLIEHKGGVYPAIVLFGRDSNLKRRSWQTVFFPYFYLHEKDYLQLKDNGYFKSLPVQEISGTKARNLMKRVMTKVTVTDAGRVGDNIKAINKLNKQVGKVEFIKYKPRTIYTYEADLSKPDMLPLRFMIDNGIRSGVDIGSDNSFKAIDFTVPLRKWYLDFEAFTLKEYTSGMSIKDPIIMISIWDNYDNKMYTYYTVNEIWKVEWQLTNFLEQYKDTFKRYDLPIKFEHEVKQFKTEANLLDALMELVLEKDPDMFIAWNLNRYDIRKWKQRMDLNTGRCVHQFRDISPMKSVLCGSNSFKIKGRILFDLMVAFKQYTDAEILSYALGYITKEEDLGFPKIPFEGTSGHTWDIRPDIMFIRNVYDVLIEKALDEKYQVSDTYNELRTEFGTLFHETFIRYRVIDTALMRLVNNKIVLKTCDLSKPPEEDSLLGAIVKEPVPDKYYWVIQLDFSREYPNIIKGFNISPETYREEPTDNCFSIEYSWTDEEGTKRDFKAYFDRSRVGLLPQLIRFFDAKRDEYQREHQKAIDNKEPEAVIRMWERRQYNVKKTTNAIYGVMDFPKFRLSRKECTQATAIVGRISVEELTKFAHKEGIEILYGDTDSMFLKLKSSTQEEALQEGYQLQKLFNEHLSEFFTEQYGVEKAPADLAFEELYKKVIFFGKKNYGAKIIWNCKKGWKEGYKFRGIASIRSDASILEKTSLEEVLKLALNDQPEEVLTAFVDHVLEEFKNRKYGVLDIAYPAQIKKRLMFKDGKWVTDYAKKNKKGRIQIPSHITSAVYTNMFLNTEFVTGDKPRRLPVKFKKSKVAATQRSLFGLKKINYPTEWEWYGKVRKVRDISIVEDMTIPEYFLDHIDYDRIEKRLKGKLYKVLLTNSNSKE